MNVIHEHSDKRAKMLRALQAQLDAISEDDLALLEQAGWTPSLDFMRGEQHFTPAAAIRKARLEAAQKEKTK